MAMSSTIQAMIKLALLIITIITLTTRHLIELSSPNITEQYNGRVSAVTLSNILYYNANSLSPFRRAATSY